jgi:hypothetical protein
LEATALLVGSEISGPLAHLDLGLNVRDERQHPPQTAWQDFLALWKDAGPDIPTLKEAKAEYAKRHPRDDLLNR